MKRSRVPGTRRVGLVGASDMDCPRCPNHPDVFLAIEESDEVGMEVMSRGGVLHMVCFYGCRAEYVFEVSR